jgi:hypothetical protein
MLLVLLPLLSLAVDASHIRLAHRQVDGVGRGGGTQTIGRGIYAVQFRAAIDAPLTRRLAAVLGYTPTEYVPPNTLVLFFNSSAVVQSFLTAFEPRVRHIEPLSKSDRSTRVAMAVHHVRQRNGTRPNAHASRTGVRAAGQRPTARMTLHVRSFFSHTGGADVDAYRGRVTGAIAMCTGAPVVRIDAATRVVSVHDVELDDAEVASDALLDALDDIYWIDALAPYETHNTWGVPAVHRATDAEAATPVGQDAASWRPLLGLRGAGQIVAISDTGVETSTCLFSDGRGASAGSVPTIAGLASVPADKGHPRIRAYSSGSGGDFRDIGTYAGHGTHTAGILGGRARNGSATAAYNGVAPDARLCVIDMLPASATSGGLFVPDETSMSKWVSACGASVHSRSYGSDNGGRYTSADYDLDMAAWTYRQVLQVVAAGNSGPAESTISSPGVGKNALTVSATMNGIVAYELAGVPSYAASTYSAARLASFASRGSSTMPFAKPDLAAPGGQYVWSAYNTAPQTGSCDDVDATTTGEAGTSMATPYVAGAGALVNQALTLDAATNGSHLLDRDGGGGLPVYASLVRAMLEASARSLTGIYPTTSTTPSRACQGYGRIALDRVLGPGVALSVLSNEKAGLAFARAGASLRACVGIASLAAGATLAGYELVLMLSYVDYPSSLVGTPALVNDLDLRVTAINSSTLVPVNALTGTETRSTSERVVVSPARAVDVQVLATTIGFGGAQTFSLIAVLRPIVPTTAVIKYTLVVSPLQSASGVCTVCSGALQPSNLCTACGNGKIEPGEQCESAISGDCCNSACQWAALKSICSYTAGTCRVQGRCAQAPGSSVTCQADATLSYAVDAIDGTSGTCQQQTAPAANATGACTRTVADWFAQLRTTGLPPALVGVETADLRICCQDFALFAFTRTPVEPVYFGLASAYIAARLDSSLPGVVIGVNVLAAMRAGKLLLESRCNSVGFTAAADRAAAANYTTTLLAFVNAHPCASTAPADDNAWCRLSTTTTAAAAEADLLCSGAPNRFIGSESRCECGATRHPEPSCSNLACSGHGASIFDPDSNAPHCVCLPGWTGSACDKCAAMAPAGMRMLCVGADADAVASGAPRHLLRAVAASSVVARVNGSFYESDTEKADDALPGLGGLDCWCRESTAAPTSADFATHLTAMADATAAVTRQLVWAEAAPRQAVECAAPTLVLRAIVGVLAFACAMM